MHCNILVPNSHPSEYIPDLRYHFNGKKISQTTSIVLNSDQQTSVDQAFKTYISECKNFPNLLQEDVLELILKRDYGIVFIPRYLDAGMDPEEKYSIKRRN